MSRGHRGSTTPMDYEWTNKNGPTDPSSPFMNIHSQQSAAKKRKLSHGPAPRRHDFSFGRAGYTEALTAGPSFGQTGTHSVVDSPSKNGFATPTRLREADNRPYFSQDTRNKPLPLPAHVQSAWEPRTPASTLDFSSGGETPNTPGADSDAATPDTQLADKMGRLGSEVKKGGRRDGWFRRAWNMGSPSPVKEKERDRDRERERERHYSHKSEHRIQKRRPERSRSKKRTLHDIDDDESDTEHDNDNDMPGSVAGKKEAGVVRQTYAMSIASFMHWVEAHPNLPSVLSFYLQLTANLVLAGVSFYILYCVWAAVLADVDIEASKYVATITVETAACAKQYTDNRCRPDERVPAMEKLCSDWERCMNRDVHKVARASVTAKTFAMIFNSFVEEFSYKSMVGIFLFVAMWVWINKMLNPHPRQHTNSHQRMHEQQHRDPQQHPPAALPYSHLLPPSTNTPSLHFLPPHNTHEDRGFADPLIE